MLYASAVNVVAITLIAPIAGSSLSRSRWLPLRIAPPAARKSSGSTKLKKAALGLRQNILRSRRYWRQPRTSVSAIGGQLQVHVLERGTRDHQLAQPPALGERAPRQLVQRRRRIVCVQLDERAVGVAVADPVALARAVAAELARRADREHAAVLDDRHAVGELLRLVEVVRRQQDRLAELA